MTPLGARGPDGVRGGLPAFGVILALILVGCAGRLPRPAPGPGPAPGGRLPVHPERPLRVAIAVEASAVEVAAAAPIALVGSRGEVVGRFKRLRLSVAEGGRIRVEPDGGAPSRCFADTLRLEPAAPGAPLEVAGKAYRGALEVFAGGAGTLTGVNVVDLEDYLLGVVPLEIGAPGPEAFEAVRAQAVAARTYALSYLNRWPQLGFDLYGDVRDQAYGGLAAERSETTRAVEETRGVVATYGGQLIRAYYSAACGGTTAAVEETWPLPPEGYLRSHKDRRQGADFCRASKHYRWEERWTEAEFMELLARYLPAEFGGAAPAGPLEDVRVEARNSSGRVQRLVVSAGGRQVAIGGDRVRWVLRRPGGGGILRSTLFEIGVERRGGRVAAVIARGAGNGHGVGLCQAGALRMAAEGYRFDSILAHYYPGIRLVRLRERSAGLPGAPRS